MIPTTESDFNRQGSLKSLVEFSFCGSISAVTLRERAKYNGQDGEKKGQEFYLLISDSYGFQVSYFRQGMTLEKAQEIAAKLPYGRTIFINGEVAVRKGNTYFNAKSFKNPDDTDILLVRLQDDEEEPTLS